jgi:hypothetical protein
MALRKHTELKWQQVLISAGLLLALQQVLFRPGLTAASITFYFSLMVLLQSVRPGILHNTLSFLLVGAAALELGYLSILICVTPWLLGIRKDYFPLRQLVPLGFLLLGMATFTEQPQLAELPRTDRVVEERSEFLSGTDPFFGSSPAYQIVDRVRLRSASLPAAVFVLLLTSIAFNRRTSLMRDKQALGFATALAVIATLDTALVPESVSLLGPLYAMERIFPGALYQPLVFGLLSYVLCLSFFASRSGVLRHTSMNAGLLIMTLILGTIYGSAAARASGLDLRSIAVFLQNYAESSSPAARDALLTSPSVQLVPLLAQRHLYTIPEKRPDSAFLRCPDIGCQVRTVSEGQEFLRHIIEPGRRPSRRDRIAVSPSNEAWFEIAIPKEFLARSIVLNSHPYYTDFPSHFSYAFSKDCVTWSQEVVVEDWKGTLVKLADGMPVLKQEGWVELHSEDSFNCFRFNKMPSTGHFDWSLTRILVAP